MEIIPSIDLIDGKCVRLRQGKRENIKYYEISPLGYASWLADNGIKRLHLVNLDAAFNCNSLTSIKAIHDICTKTKLIVDVGGGVRTLDDINKYFDLGVGKVCLGTISVKDEHMTLDVINEFGFDKIILCPDVRDNCVVTEGWTESSTCSIFDYINSYFQYGQRDFICTDVSKDGMLSGTSIDLYFKILSLGFKGLNLIASGGVSAIKDIEMLDSIGVPSVIIGKALFEQKININDLKQWLM